MILLAMAVLAFAGLAVGQQFNYKTVSIAGWTNTAAYGINDFGVQGRGQRGAFSGAGPPGLDARFEFGDMLREKV